MDEAVKALGPYPILQMIFGMIVLGIGVISIIKGLTGKEPPRDAEADWKAREQLTNIEENSWKIVNLLEKQNELLGRFISIIYNKAQF